MPDPVWFRSLYWRIAIGFVAMLALLLLVQAALFLWLTGRFTVSPSSRTPQELADLVARELSDAFTDNPELHLETVVKERFGDLSRPFAVVMRDGRRASNRPEALPPGFGERPPRGGPRGGPPFGEPRPPFERRDRFDEPAGRGEAGRGAPPEGGGPGPQGERAGPPPFGDRPPPPPDFRRRGGGRGPGGLNFAPIVVNGTQIGHVAVPSGPPPMEVMMRELAPTLTWTGLGLLTVGAMVTALVIFRPARKRLRSLEDAARALGEGRSDVRADERGGDEVSALAHTFNQMAAELDSRATALNASDRARRQLLADVSHELMTPLTAIRGYTQTLAMPGLTVDESTRTRYFDIVDHETYKLEAIIGDLLDLAKLEGGADPQRLEQALQNVASNAIRHTPDGGRIELRAVPDGEQLRITVRDTGPGIPVEHLPHIFDRFYKVDASRTATGTPSGSGLGLSIVRAIVERHGGTITASNAPGGGAQFEIILPKRGG